MVQLLWRMVWQLLIKLNMALPCDPANLLLAFFTRWLRTCVCMKTSVRMFIVRLTVELKCPSKGERINCLWYTT